MYIPAQRNVLWVVAFFGFVMVKRSSSGTDMFFLGGGESSTYGVVALCNRPAALDANCQLYYLYICIHAHTFYLLMIILVTKRIELVR